VSARHVLVTGAAGGIGLAVAEAFATRGDTVTGVDARGVELDAAMAGLAGGRGTPYALVADLSDDHLEMATKACAVEFADRGIRVNAVAPGFVEVDSPVNPVTDEYAAAVSVNPTGRPGRPDEIAAAVVWLAGAEAGFVTGAVLRVDGGASAGTSALPVHHPSITALQRAEA
jgi:NAD(P)-dependent dehydrogenase (short-subunit alcohol dehydrogenase family)